MPTKKAPLPAPSPNRATKIEVELSNLLQSAIRAHAAWERSSQELQEARRSVKEAEQQLAALENRLAELDDETGSRQIAEAQALIRIRTAKAAAIAPSDRLLDYANAVITASRRYDQIWEAHRNQVEEAIDQRINHTVGCTLRDEHRADLREVPELVALDTIYLKTSLTEPTLGTLGEALLELKRLAPKLAEAIRQHADACSADLAAVA